MAEYITKTKSCL